VTTTIDRMFDANNSYLVTLSVMAFNQEKYVREAIESAFAQTYHPLEIILSDDSSNDSTFKIMQELAASYTGPHKVVLNQNTSNLGYVKHIDRIMEIANGDLIIANAGDDVSLPERAEIFAKAWLQAPDEITLVHSPVELIDENSDIIGKFTSPQCVLDHPSPLTIASGGFTLGASMAWHRKIFEVFGPMGDGISVEDTVIPFRASLLGKIEYIPEELLKWRVGGESNRKSQCNKTHEYMYGTSHRLRKWRSENAFYILDRFQDVTYPSKVKVESVCRKRAETLRLAVDLAESSRSHRWVMLPRATRLALRHGSTLPLKDWVRYTFDLIYIRYANWRTKKDSGPRSRT